MKSKVQGKEDIDNGPDERLMAKDTDEDEDKNEWKSFNQVRTFSYW